MTGTKSALFYPRRLENYTKYIRNEDYIETCSLQSNLYYFYIP